MRYPSTLVVWAGAAWAAPALAADAGGASLIQPKVGTFFWTLVTFFLLAVLLGRYAWKPLIGAIDARERGIRDTLDRARSDREEAERLLTQHHELLAQARRERAEAVAQGQRDAERLREEILAEARRQREQILAQAEAQLEAGVREARAELRALAADLAIGAAEKLLSKNLDDATQRRLVEEHLAELEQRSDRLSS